MGADDGAKVLLNFCQSNAPLLLRSDVAEGMLRLPAAAVGYGVSILRQSHIVLLEIIQW